MIKKTEKELLGMTLEELGFNNKLCRNTKRVTLHMREYDINGDRLSDLQLRIELQPEMPRVNIKNLGLFMALTDRYPEAIFSHGKCINDGSESGSLTEVGPNGFRSDSGDWFIYCQIDDERWHEIGGGE